MSILMRFWTRMVECAKALDGIDDPVGDYILSLGKRVETLERQVEVLEGKMRSRAGSGINA